MQAIYATCSTSITELKRNPTKVIQESDGRAVVILNHNKPMAYLVPAAAYEAVMELLEDAELAAIAASREQERGQAIEVSLDEL